MTAPLIHSIDLRDTECMLMHVQRLLSSDTWLLAEDNPAIGFALVNLWLNSWHQVPAGSLPSDERLLAKLARVGAIWPDIRADVMAGWVLCDDGRYYHPTLVELVDAAEVARIKARRLSVINSGKGRRSVEVQAAAKAGTKPTEVSGPASLPAAVEEDVDRTSLPIQQADPRQISLLDDEPVGAAMVAAEVVVYTGVKPLSPAKQRDAARRAKASDDAIEVFDHWKQVHNKPKALFTGDRLKNVMARLKEYDKRDLLLAIDGCRLTPHNMGQTDGNLYNDLELICRNGGKVEFFRDKALGNDKASMPIQNVRNETTKTMDAFDAYLQLDQNLGDSGDERGALS